MEFIVIDEDKLKMMLTKSDLEDFELFAEELDYERTETKRMLWDLLARAKRRTGFDTDGERVLVQVYPSRDGGCEIFVTKLGVHPDGEDDAPYGETYSEEQTKETQGKKWERKEKTACAYVFLCIDTLLRACRRLDTLSYGGKSSAYIAESGECYLFLEDVSASPYLPVHRYSFLHEYGKAVSDPESTRAVLAEHAACVCDGNAVQRLGALCS